jgi:nucleotide-binding universal stress UspA family protein
VTHQVLFVGESFFIPIFLMYIGMITDPLAIVVNLETLLMGLALTVLVYLTKYLAAWLIARIFAYSKDERLTMWGLSQAQAAATLATILVGQEIGLFPESIFNGAILMVLLTSISSPWLVQRFGSRLQNGAVEEDDRSIFDRILIPVANPETQGHLTTLATILANTTKGVIMPLVVIPEVRGRAPDLSKQERLPESTTRDQTEVEVLPIRRIDTSVAKGILRAAAENQATLITMGWRGRPTFAQTLTRRSRIFGDVLDSVVWDADIPVAVSRLTMGINAMQRVFLVMRANSIGPNLLGAMVEMALSVAKAINVPLLILADTDYISGIRESLEAGKDEYPVEIVGLSTNAVRDVKDRADEHDLVLITSTGSKGRFQSSIGRTPEEIVAATECSVVVLRFPDKAANLVE